MSNKKSLDQKEVSVSNLSLPGSFQCNSGVLLWGQGHCIYESSLKSGYDLHAPTETLTGGTILQNGWNYKTRAKIGKWIVQEAFMDGDHVGYVSNHETASGLELLKRCAQVGISNGNSHSDTKVTYINRYDWGYHHGDPDSFFKLLSDLKMNNSKKKKKKEEVEADNELYQELCNGRCFLLDGDYYDGFMKCLSTTDLSDHKTLYLKDKDSTTSIGVQMSHDGIEYELAWLVFDENDEMIGFTYDSTYSALESQQNPPIFEVSQ